MPEYLVTWQIDMDADSPEEAAAKALLVMRDPESTATVFTVQEKCRAGYPLAPVVVDLNEDQHA